MPKLSEVDLRHVWDALLTFEAELDQLEGDSEWTQYVPDSRDMLLSAKQIVADALGIVEDITGEVEANELIQRTLKLH